MNDYVTLSDLCVTQVLVNQEKVHLSSKCELFTAVDTLMMTSAVLSNLCTRTSSWQWIPWYGQWNLWKYLTEIQQMRLYFKQFISAFMQAEPLIAFQSWPVVTGVVSLYGFTVSDIKFSVFIHVYRSCRTCWLAFMFYSYFFHFVMFLLGMCKYLQINFWICSSVLSSLPVDCRSPATIWIKVKLIMV